jgi:RNA polymerase sigma factor (sigma-70 family)
MRLARFVRINLVSIRLNMPLIEEVTEMGVGDVGELYGSFADRLEQIVRLDVRASDAVIEDACQVAWFRLLHHCQRVHRETVMAWLARTAVHEAFRLLRRARRELPLDAAIEDGKEPACWVAGATPHELVELRERLQEVHRLPERQQRLVWLHAFGLSYAEMAAYEGCTPRTVDRQLLRARRTIRGNGGT